MRPNVNRRRFNPVTLTLAGVLGVAMGLLLAAAANTNAFGAAGAGFSPCLPGSQPVNVHYGYAANSTAPARYGLNAYTLTGFDAACDGDAIVVTVSGNPAGDPAAPVTEILGSYDTKLDPCTRQPATQPAVITHGAISLRGCANYGVLGRPANLHDTTRLHLEVGGRNLPISVLGTSLSRASSSGSTSLHSGWSGAALAFTGSWAALTFWIGVSILLAGGALVALGSPRHRPVTAS